MKVTRTSIITGTTRTMDLPITEEQMALYESPNAPLIQSVFPHLSNDQREFIMTGITQAEWDEYITGPYRFEDEYSQLDDESAF